ncbi:hypothetical protein HBI07_160180 [Parastagonospora nodorum]|nr:hypothetical protein HBI07_160180 [Parastagonospora nodorum]
MQKLKAVFRSSSKKRAAHPDGYDQHPTDATLPQSSRSDRRATSLDERRSQKSSEASKAGNQQHGRSRPLSSVYDSRLSNASGAQVSAVDHAQPQQHQGVNSSIASDYQAYLPALTPVHDSQDEQHTLGGDRRLMVGQSDTLHEEDVADRNIDRYRTSLVISKRKPLPEAPVPEEKEAERFNRRNSTASGISSKQSAATGKYSLGTGDRTTGGLIDSISPHTEATAHEKNHWKKTDWPAKSARAEPQVNWGKRRPQGSESEDGQPQYPPDNLKARQQLPIRLNETPHHPRVAVDGQDDIEREIEQLLGGVVDLRNTVDEDKDVQWAPAVTHEIVKPHEHEIIQHKIFREIHNYEHYYRIQPVYDLEILPPRHWKPNPNGQGLIEISADEIPSQTGHNRRWKIVQEHTELPAGSQPIWRKEPEIIEHPTTITAEGFERKETTIIHPPTLQDMSEYDGPVQPVHFDHKTGKRWLGEITTMHKLRNELGQVSDPNVSLKELGQTLPEVPALSNTPHLSQSPSMKRKPINGKLHGANQPESVAIAL